MIASSKSEPTNIALFGPDNLFAEASPLRMTLVSLGLFGPPRGNLKDLLHEAFVDFKCWKKREKVSCTQRRFTPGSVCKEQRHYMKCKAFNARCVVEWLRDATARTLARDFRPELPLGRWLTTTNQEVPEDPRLVLQQLALSPICFI